MRSKKGFAWTVVLSVVSALALRAANADEVADLIHLLKSKDPLLCARAARDVGKLGSKGEAAIPALISLLGNTAPGEASFQIVYQPVRQFAIEALQEIGPRAVPALLAAIEGDQEEIVREGAVLALSGIEGNVKEVVPALGKALNDPSDRVRAVAVQGITRHGESAGGMINRVSKLLRGDSSEQVRVNAARLLPLLDPEGRSSIAELKRALSDSKASVRVQAARSLADFGVKSNDVMSRLIDLLADKGSVPFCYSADFIGSCEVRGAVAVVLGDIGPVAKSAVSVLARLRDDGSCPFETRVNAAVAVIRILPKDDHAVSAFIRLLEDEEMWASDLLPLLQGLDKLRTRVRGALPAIRRHLKQEDGSIRCEAIRGLAYAGGASAVPDLIDLLQSVDIDARTEAARVLGEIGPDARAAVPALLKFLDDVPEGQWTAIEALGLIGPSAKTALPRLRESLKSADADTSEIISKAVKGIAGE